MEDQNLNIRIKDGVARLTINRPTAKNSLESSVLGDLFDAFTVLGRNDAIKMVVLEVMPDVSVQSSSKPVDAL